MKQLSNSMEGQVHEMLSRTSNWKPLEKDLYLKGVEMFGKNRYGSSCFFTIHLTFKTLILLLVFSEQISIMLRNARIASNVVYSLCVAMLPFCVCVCMGVWGHCFFVCFVFFTGFVCVLLFVITLISSGSKKFR